MVKSLSVTSSSPPENPLFEKRVKTTRIGGIQPHRNLRYYVRWANYIKFQRQRKLLLHSLKVPPALTPFYRPLQFHTTHSLIRLLNRYKPESRASKQLRLKEQSKNASLASSKPNVLKFGLKHVTHLVEKGLAKLVVIAYDVDPIELVVWLPALCETMSVPYCIIRNKDKMGKLTRTKTCTAIALTEINQRDLKDFDLLLLEINKQFLNNTFLKRWEYPRMGPKRAEKIRLIHLKLYEKWKIEFQII